MGVDLGKVAGKAATNPLGAAGDILKGALGIGGPSRAQLRNRSYVDVHNKIRAGNYDGLADAVRNSQWLGARWEAAWALVNRSTDAAQAVIARQQAGIPRDTHPSTNLALTQELVSSIPSKSIWAVNTSPAPSAAPSTPSPESTTPSTSPSSAPAAPKPCPPGKERNPETGRCRKIPTTETSSFLGPAVPAQKKAQRPCKYGPRDQFGYCPKKTTSRLTKAQSTTVRRAAAAAEKVVTAGLVGAGRAIKVGLAAAGIGAGAAAATVASVAGAALLGWFLGNGIREFYETNSVEQVKANAAVRANHARRALAERLGVYDPDKPGVGLTLEQQAGIRKAYNDSIAAIERSGRDTAYAERVRASLGDPNAQVF